MSARRNSGLDLLRAIAISCVVLLHASQVAAGIPYSLLWLSTFGWMGVDIFFVLSGFLIASQFFSAKGESSQRKLAEFYLKRSARTWPLYFTVLAFYVLVKPALGFPFQGDAKPYLFFGQNYLGISDFVQSWSLCIEEQFYLFFPLVALALGTLPRARFLWLLPLLFSFGLRFAWDRSNPFPDFTTICQQLMFKTHYHLDGISVGVFLASTHQRWSKWSVGATRTSLAAGLALVIFALATSGPLLEEFGKVYCFTFLAAGFGLMFPWFERFEVPGVLRTPVEKIAIWSFGIYLWNDTITRLMHKIALGPRLWPLAYVLFLLLSVLIAAITYALVEKPALRVRNRILASREKRAVLSV